MLEIIFISVAGLITVGLSINSLIKSDKQEEELKLKQEQLSEAQSQIISKQNELIKHQSLSSQELKSKSDEIIRLQNLLQEKSIQQVQNLNRLQNPIPEDLLLTFFSTLEFTISEYEEIHQAVIERVPSSGNFLPFHKEYLSKPIQKINLFRDCRFIVRIELHQGERSMSISLNMKPLLFGFNTTATGSNFTLYDKEDDKKIGLACFDMPMYDIKCNYSNPSLIDFDSAYAKITFEFATPQKWQMGNFVDNLYITLEKNESISLNLTSLSLKNNNIELNFSELRKVDKNVFLANYKRTK